MKRIWLLSAVIFLFFTRALFADVLRFNGEASAWASYTKKANAGLRYLPELALLYRFEKEDELEGDLVLNSYLYTPERAGADLTNFAGVKPYRMWVRFKTSRFETRLGLQKINFGPARILRSLMWFDQVDPRDPLKITDGVYGLLVRYYFQNNADVWVWGLYGNKDLKGLEIFKTDRKRPEYGGRFEFPFLAGDAGFSFNRRYISQDDWKEKMMTDLPDGSENRAAVEGTWDIGIGVWFEAAVEELKITAGTSTVRDFLTLGGDYTLTSGLHFLAEHFFYTTGSAMFRSGKVNHVSALEADYPLTILDSINMIDYYDWNGKRFYFFLGWQRTYDNWKINLMGFSGKKEEGSVFSNRGVELLLTFNH